MADWMDARLDCRDMKRRRMEKLGSDYYAFVRKLKHVFDYPVLPPMDDDLEEEAEFMICVGSFVFSDAPPHETDWMVSSNTHLP